MLPCHCYMCLLCLSLQPFGEGLITVVVPQLRRGENSLLLWNIANHTAPVHTFVGHTDVVLEFEWRKHREGQYFFSIGFM